MSAPPERCGYFKTYGSDAIQVMTENPYRLARDIRGIGFRTADAIANKLGIEKSAMIRVRAGISYALTEAIDEGHCGLPTDELVTGSLPGWRSIIGRRTYGGTIRHMCAPSFTVQRWPVACSQATR